MKHTYSKLFFGIKRKMLLLLSAVFLLLILVLGIVSSQYASEAVSKNIISSLDAKSQYLINTLDSYITELKNTLFFFSYNTGLNEILQSSKWDGQEYYLAFKDLNSAAKAIVTPKNYCDLFVYMPSRKYIYSTDSRNTISNACKSQLQYSPDDTAGGQTRFYSVLNQFIPPIPMKDEVAFAVTLTLPNISDEEEENNTLIITCAKSYFDDIFRGTFPDDTDDFVFITPQDSHLIYSYQDFTQEEQKAILESLNAAGDQPESVFSLSFRDKQYTAYVKQSASTNWKITFCSDNAAVQSEVSKINSAIFFATFLVCMLMFASVFMITHGITTPLIKLKHMMKKVEQGDFTQVAEIRNNDEIGELSRSFNKMVEQINFMVNEVYHSRLFQREAELYALQQQINPHFLYNTLGTINSLASMQRYQEIREAVQKLAGIFRYSIQQRGSSFAAFADELQYAQSYMSIQKLRFQERVQVTFDIEPEIEKLMTPRLLLQPIIENCIEHGLDSESVRCLHIVVQGKSISQDAVLIQVGDNGVGIPREKLAELQEMLKKEEKMPANPESLRSSSIGLNNVNMRIRLLFKQNYHLTISSDGGTLVSIKLPKITKEETAQYEQPSLE